MAKVMTSKDGTKSQKKFLNAAPSEGGAVRWHVTKVGEEVEITVSDCNRTSTLCFGTWERGQVRERLKKLAKFREYINDFCDAAEEALEKRISGKD